MSGRDETPWPHVTLVLGGARSGKSRHAEALVRAAGPAPWTYVATAEAWDDEMRARIAHHRAERAASGGGGWVTVDAPLDPGGALLAAPAESPVLVDCLTLWLTNLMLGGHDVDAASEVFFAALSARRGPVVLVANEVGLGIVPENALARAFRDAAGRLNQRIAARAGRVLFIVAGLPIVVK
ncbi:bifunctional adenosylcobinamide kinase/adenosylcobinamide-phosphate guanylyltransferase [Zavarzinia aquatilis]|uniref:Bifunctional adenosylcobalamin biosynthesis protein n=1 Tax=Zavarzinia aquatilis TaxID=2211142 RepID=A0A317EI56_9PROT|nr:bifunctional adenosylcobinamide kinase/adenosylcobinamide-phosphate guanylyltransferase [Zavarzinia aquatilis]PWR25750.1 bifunctional adenosylcobinamide kinase/adenosylcobinamide-phosphate guanylyltransferase [Zavarzinia aquatilis]